MDSTILKDEKIVEKSTPDNSREGIQPKTKTKIDLANEAAERAEKAVKEARELADRLDAHKADEILSGEAEAGMIKPKPKPMTEREYAHALAEGRVNPLKDDGYFC